MGGALVLRMTESTAWVHSHLVAGQPVSTRQPAKAAASRPSYDQQPCASGPLPLWPTSPFPAWLTASNCSNLAIEVTSTFPACLQFRNGMNGNCLAVDNSTQFIAQKGALAAACVVPARCPAHLPPWPAGRPGTAAPA